MKFALFSFLLAVLAALALAAPPEKRAVPQKPVIISYPDDTPESVLEDAMHAIKKAGGFITHEYRLIKAFAAKATEESLAKVSAMGSKYNAVIEEDQLVSVTSNNG